MSSIAMFYGTATFLFGLVFGSFLNVVIYRVPRGESVVRPRSRCPNCGAAIAFYDNVPVFSWLLLRGRCRQCGTAISPRYLVVELLTGGLFLACYLQFDLTPALVKYCFFSFLVLGLIFIDADWKLLPDVLTLPGLAMGLLLSLFVPLEGVSEYLLPAGSIPLSTTVLVHLFSFTDAVVGAALGAFLIWGAGALYFAARGIEGMGFGDVKFMAMIGAFLGPKLTLLVLFAASVLGALFGLGTMLAVWVKRTRRRRKTTGESLAAARRRAWQSARLVYRRYEMPFGVFLGAVSLGAVFGGSRLIAWYTGLYR